MRLRWPVRRPRLGVVLGGGGTRGAFEVGVIDVFARLGIVPDFLVGTSVGAINAAFWALHPGPDVGPHLLDFWLKSNRSTVLPDGPLPMVGRLFGRRDHLTTQTGLVRALRSAIPTSVSLEDTPVPLAVTCTDATRGERVVLRQGPLLPALLASAAIPGVWPAVDIDGRRLIDGGLVANCDIESSIELGATDVVAVDVMSACARTPKMDMRDVVEQTVEIALRRQTDLIASMCARMARLAILRRGSSYAPRFADLTQTVQLYREGQSAARAFVARHIGRRRTVMSGRYDAGEQVTDAAMDAEPQAIPA